jgi:hypothetical protein
VRNALAVAAAAAVAIAVTACGTGGDGSSSATTTSTPTTTSTGTAGTATGTASTEAVAWAGSVCTEVTGLGTSLQSVAADAVKGGDVQGALNQATTELKASADQLVASLSAPPQGTEGEVGPIRSSATELRTSLDALQQSVTAVGQASNPVGTVTALKDVAGAAAKSLEAASTTSSAISTVAKDSGSQLRAAFESAPECAPLLR